MKSGFFLIAGNIFSGVESFFWDLARVQEHLGFTAVLQCLKAAYGAQLASSHKLNTLLFHQERAAFFNVNFTEIERFQQGRIVCEHVCLSVCVWGCWDGG